MPEEMKRLALLETWYREFREYVGCRRIGMERTGDFPDLCVLYDKSKAALALKADEQPLAIEFIVNVTQAGIPGEVSAEHQLTICGVDVPCELTLFDGRELE